jgi:RHS repeat-associated protein
MKNIISVLCLVLISYLAQSQAVSPESNNKPATITSNTAVTSFPGLQGNITQTKRNFVRTFSPIQPVTAANQGTITINTFSPKHKVETRYYDFLGRPLQEVYKWTAFSSQDLVKTHVYDGFGREEYEYPPYTTGTTDGKFKANVYSGFTSRYNSAYPGEEPYSKKEYDGSPIGREIKAMLPGRNWVGSNRGVTSDITTNDNNFTRFTIGYLNTDLPVKNGYYDPSELFITVTTDEDGKFRHQVKDKFDRLIAVSTQLDDQTYTQWDPSLGPITTILKRHKYTYYVYDDFGRLRCVLPPLMNLNTINTTTVAELCYTYFYDKKGRLIEKKLPGKEIEYYVYDKLDRLVATQDGNQRINHEWHCYLYDVQNRPLIEAIYTYGGTRTALENEINTPAQSYNSQELMYYLSGYNAYRNPFSLSFLPTDATLTTRNYYDDYNYPNLSFLSYDASLNSFVPSPATAETLPSTPSSNTRGLLTFSSKRVQEPNGGWPATWIYTIMYYNNKGQVIQTQTSNLGNTFDVQSTRYYFTGEVAGTALKHTHQGTVTTIAKAYHKDPNLQRISHIEQSINGAPFTTISYLTYDFLGRVANKRMGTNFNNQYTYDIHGWLTGINPSYVDNGIYDGTYGPFFGEKLSYDKGFASKLYNGNIAGIQWRKSTGAPKEFYGYTYDNNNQLKYAEYGKWEPPASNTAAAWTKNFTDFTASNLTYDENGNIKTMDQRGPTHTSSSNGTIIPGDMDQLVYEYLPNSNKLKTVTENATGVHITANPDFQDDLYAATQDYDYDVNGNLVKDANKGLGYYSFPTTYSLHNKPLVISFDDGSTLEYTYDAAGNKLKKVVTPAQTSTPETWIYTPSGFVYKNNMLQYILHEEGRVRVIPNFIQGTTDYAYDYFMKDHLGNVRSVVGTNEIWVSDPSSTNPTAPSALIYRATMEVANAGTETAIWEYLTEVTDINPFPTASEDAKAARLNADEAGRSIGTALMLRTMPGDKINIEGYNYYTNPGDPGQNATTNTEITDALLTALTGGVNVNGIPINELPDNIATLQSTVGGGSLPTLLDAMETSLYDPALPASGLVWVVFNEAMEPMENLSGTVQASGADEWAHADAPTIDIQQPGYILIFAKSTANKSVWWNNLKVTVLKGTILEENHYYPFGLTLSQGTTTPGEKNEYRYNGKELQSDFGLNWYNYGARQYDMQTGRWLGIDPMADKYYSISPIGYVANNPVKYIDPDGRLILNYSAAQLKDYGLTKTQVTRFENIVNNIYNLVRDNQQAIAVIANTTGFSSERIASDLQPGSGPTVDLLKIGGGARGGKDGIVFDPAIIKYLASIDGADKAELSEQTLAVGLAILHEYGHYGDQVTNNGNNSGQYRIGIRLRSDGKTTFKIPEQGGVEFGIQKWKTSLTGHRGTDIEVMGFGVNYSVDDQGKHIKDPAVLSPIINSEGLTIPSELPENASGDNILNTLNVK